jgi:hypothetical protein
MRVDANIATAITNYLTENNLSAAELCKKLGVSEPAFVKWRRPGKGITQRYWDELFPLIKTFLPPERIYIDGTGKEQYSSMLDGTGGNPYFTPKYIPQMVPVFSVQEMKEYPHIVQSIEQYAININAQRIEYRPRKQGCGSGVFAMNVDFENSVIPVGALLFASAEVRPVNGCVIMFSDSSGEISIGRYTQTADKYSIEYGNDSTVCGLLSEIRAKISWIFPVLYYEVVTF